MAALSLAAMAQHEEDTENSGLGSEFSQVFRFLFSFALSKLSVIISELLSGFVHEEIFFRYFRQCSAAPFYTFHFFVLLNYLIMFLYFYIN